MFFFIARSTTIRGTFIIIIGLFSPLLRSVGHWQNKAWLVKSLGSFLSVWDRSNSIFSSNLVCDCALAGTFEEVLVAEKVRVQDSADPSLTLNYWGFMEDVAERKEAKHRREFSSQDRVDQNSGERERGNIASRCPWNVSECENYNVA